MKTNHALHLFMFALLLLGIAGCSASQASSQTPTAAPTPTRELVNLEGRLFFDKNATGLQDEATYLPCLNQRCDPITEMEPGLAGFEVCTSVDGMDYCASTTADGSFSMALPARQGDSLHVSISDPNAGTAEQAMRFINLFEGEVVIPAYTLKGKVGNYLVNEEDGTSRWEEGILDPDIYYQGEVAEQRLYDTNVIKLEEGAELKIGEDNHIGLMNERIVYPFRLEDFSQLNINGGFDHDLEEGSVIDFAGNTQKASEGYAYLTCTQAESTDSPFVCTVDGHVGLDYGYKGSPKGIPLFAAQEGYINVVVDQSDGLNIYLASSKGFDARENANNDILLLYSHSDSFAVEMLQHVYRGQLIGFLGNTGTMKNYPHVHLSTVYGPLCDNPNGISAGGYDKDFYACTIPEFIIRSKCNGHSIWTVWNQPVFYPIDYQK